MSFFFNPQAVFVGPQCATSSAAHQGAANSVEPAAFPFVDIIQALVPIAVHQQHEQQELCKQRCHQNRQHQYQRVQKEHSFVLPFESLKSQTIPSTHQQYKIVEQLSDGTIILRPCSKKDDLEYRKQQELFKHQQQVKQLHEKQQQQLRDEQHRKESEATLLAFQRCFQSFFQQNEQCADSECQVGKQKGEEKNDQRKLEKEQTKELLEQLFGSSCVIQFNDDGYNDDDGEKQQEKDQEQDQFPLDQLASLFGLPLSLFRHCSSEPHLTTSHQEQAKEQNPTIGTPDPASASIITTTTQVTSAPTTVSNTTQSEAVSRIEAEISLLDQHKDLDDTTNWEPKNINDSLVASPIQSASPPLFSNLLAQNEKLFTKRLALSNKIRLLQQTSSSSLNSSEQTQITALQHNIQQIDVLIAQLQSYTDQILADLE